MIPAYVVVPVVGLMVPPPAFSVRPRFAFRVVVPVTLSVPPSNVSESTVGDPGAVPSRASELIERMPPLMLVLPVKVFAPDSVTVPEVVLFRLPEPPRMPLTVPLCSSNVPVVERTPVEPEIVPPLASVTLPTVSELAPSARMAEAPSTATVPLLSELLAPRVSEPALTIVPPV